MILTQKDLDDLEKLIDEKLDEKIKHLPNKHEFFKAMDEIMGELKSLRESYEIIGPQVVNHKARLERLEKTIFKS